MGRSGRILTGLALGMLLGGLVAAFAPGWSATGSAILEPVGKIWLDALKMTVVPLVFALLVTGIAGAAGAAAAGSVTARALATFLALLTLGALLSVAVATTVLALAPADAGGLAGLRASIDAGAVPPPPPFAEFVKTIVPANIVKAAADGAMLSIVVVALLFGFALARIDAGLRAAMLGFFEGLTATMLVIVGWVLWVAPLGVFALAYGVTAGGGFAVLGAIGYYLLLASGICLLVALAGYPVAWVFGGVAPGRFARAAAPAQAVAISTQSSLAAMPAMLAGAQDGMGIPPRVAGVVLPMAVALFRVTSPAANLAIALFAAQVYGIEIGAAQLIPGIIVAVIISMATVSLPSQITFFTAGAPIFLAMGIPLDLLAILIAVETLVDIFRTLGNVTLDLAATAIVAKRSGEGTNG